MRTIALLAAGLMLPISGVAAETAAESVTVYPKKPKQPSMDVNVPDYSLHTLDFNFPTGLRILMQPDRSYPIVTVMSVVDHGSVSDPVGKEGIAHFVEHAWFRSKHGDLPPIMDVIQDMGCPFNATTRPDWTDYRTTCASRLLPSLLRFESLRLTNTVIGVTEEEITTEREVVRNELRMNMEQGSTQAISYLYDHLYPESHPYHRLTIGTHGSLDNVKLADIQKFTDDYYRAEKTTIMVTGDFDPEESLSLILQNFELALIHPGLTDEHLFQYPRDKFVEDPDSPGKNMLGEDFVAPDEDNPDHWLTGAWDPEAEGELLDIMGKPKRRLSLERPEPPDLGNPEVGEYEAPMERPNVIIAWSLPAGFRDDEINYSALGFMATAMLQQRFGNSEVGYQIDGIGDSGCFYQGGRYGASLLCFVEYDDDKLKGEDVAEQAVDQIPMMWYREPPSMGTETEGGGIAAQIRAIFSRSKMEQLSGILGSLDTIVAVFGGRTEDIVVHAHLTGDAKAHTAMMEQTMKLEQHEVALIAEKYLKRSRAAVVILKPIPEEDVVKDGSDAPYHGAQRADDVAAGDNLEGVTDAQIAAEGLRPDFTGFRDVTLDNGLRVVVQSQGEAPIGQATLIMGGGSGMEPLGMGEFFRVFSRGEREDSLRFAGFWSFGQSSNMSTDGLSMPTGNIDAALWSMRTYLESLEIDMAYKPDWIRRSKKAVKKSWKYKSYWIDKHQREHLYPGHPFGFQADYDDYDAMAKWSGGDAKTALGRVYQPTNATLLIVGPVDPDIAVEQARIYMSGWEADPRVEQGVFPGLPAPGASGASTILLFDEPKATQTQVSLACPTAPGTAADEPARKVVTKLLSDQAFKTLRVHYGLTYGAYAYSQSDPSGAGALFFASLSTNEGVPKTIEVFQDLASAAEAGEFDDNLVRQSKLRLVRQANVSAQSAGQMSDALIGPIRWGQDPRSIADTPEQLVVVTEAQMQARVQGCSDHALITLEGPKDVLGPMLDEKGVEYTLVDWKQMGDERLLQYDPKAYKKMMKKREKDAAKKAKEDEKGDEGEKDEDEE